MPKLWSETIQSHRQEVHEAIQEVAARLVFEQGLRSVTMSRIAEETGIGRATLYKYYPSVESILHEWHERQINEHLSQLAAIRDASQADARLEAVLEAYALITYQSRKHQDTELATLMHRHGRVAHAEQQLHRLVRELVTEAQQRGAARDDLAVDDVTNYCLHALTAASRMRSKAAVLGLVEVILDGLRPA